MSEPPAIDLINDPITDPTTSKPDHLSTLPPELLHEIISYLFPTHHFLTRTNPHDTHDKAHPLLHLSSTSKLYRKLTNQWCNAWLHHHSRITKYKDVKNTKIRDTRNYMTGRFGLLTWTRKHCVFCGKHSVRRAIMMNGLRCCKACDRREWDKITKTEASRRFKLGDDVLGLARGEGGRPIRLCQYVGVYGWTTMMMKEDARWLARRVHGERVVELLETNWEVKYGPD